MEKGFKTYEEHKTRLVNLGRRAGFTLNLDNPVTIQDKINWMKIYDSTPLKTRCADKVAIHDYCKEKIGEDLCVPIIAVWDRVEDVKWDELPKSFVIKCNHGSGMNIIVKDKATLNIQEATAKLNGWMKNDFAFRVGYEMHYHGIPHKVFAEEYMVDENQKNSLYDYKFWCFNGEPKFMTVNNGHGHGEMACYDMDFKRLDIDRVDLPIAKGEFIKPLNFDRMIEYSKKLSTDFRFVRVDFYEVSGKLYLGELTFTPGAGFMKYKNPANNKIVGDMLTL